MTNSLKREAAHHNTAAHPTQKSRHGAGVEIVPERLAEEEATAPVQPRAPPSRMLRFPQVIERTGLSRTTLWRRIKAGTFPAPLSLGENSVGFPEHLITDWIESRPAVTYAPAPEANVA